VISGQLGLLFQTVGSAADVSVNMIFHFSQRTARDEPQRKNEQ
jgi:hypothetical protein